MEKLSEFSELVHDVNSMDDLFSHLCEVSEAIGYEYVAFGPVEMKFEKGGSEFSESNWIKFPEDWSSHYFLNDCRKFDPVINYAFRLSSAQTWQELINIFNVDKKQKEFMGQARDFGLTTGVTVPLRGPNGRISICSFATGSAQRPSFQVVCLLASLAQVMTVAEHRITQMANDQRDVALLTDRQVECLRWTAMGKSSWDISFILGISENTVNYHIKEAMRRLGTASRVTAAIRCSNLGLFDSTV